MEENIINNNFSNINVELNNPIIVRCSDSYFDN